MQLRIVFGRNGTQRIAHRVLWPLAAAIPIASCSSTDEPPDPFDTPFAEISVDAGPWGEAGFSDVRITLTCYFYRYVMVKEYDIGGSGAVGLSMLSYRDRRPACEPSPEPDERVIDYSEWEGYLKGVKDTLVFFDPIDDFNGHSPFAVFDSVTGQQIFEDTAYGAQMPSLSDGTSRLQVMPTVDGYTLRYWRAADADCNLNVDGRMCWKRIQAKFGLLNDKMPVCTGYEHIAALVGTDDVESVIAYPVEVTLFPRPIVRVLAGDARCWASQ